VKRLIYILPAALLIFGCRHTPEFSAPPLSEESRPDTRSCWSKVDRELVLKAILDTEDFQLYLHPEVEGRLPVLLSENAFVTPDLTLFSNGQKVVVTEYDPNPESTTHKITITHMDCAKEALNYSVYYPVEGAFLEGAVEKIQGRWVATVSHVGEKN
jgi:PBP1b-binding outer membrane lipoprotein LpoB